MDLPFFQWFQIFNGIQVEYNQTFLWVKFKLDIYVVK